MSGVSALFQMALGGAVCGSFLGIFTGGLLVALIDVSLGLDGALFGGGAGCLCGMLLGATLALRGGGPAEQPSSVPMKPAHDAEDSPAPEPLRHQEASARGDPAYSSSSSDGAHQRRPY